MDSVSINSSLQRRKMLGSAEHFHAKVLVDSLENPDHVIPDDRSVTGIHHPDQRTPYHHTQGDPFALGIAQKWLVSLAAGDVFFADGNKSGLHRLQAFAQQDLVFDQVIADKHGEQENHTHQAVRQDECQQMLELGLVVGPATPAQLEQGLKRAVVFGFRFDQQ